MLEEISNDELTLKSNHMSRDLMSKLSRLRSDDLFTDVTIVIGDSEFRAHKLVLCVCSKYFEVMLTTGFTERTNDRIEIKGLDSSAFSSVLTFFYSGLLRVNQSNLCPIIEAVDLLLLEETKKSLEKFICNTVKADRAVLYKRLADTYSMTEAQDCIGRFIRRNFEYIIDTDNFEELSKEELEDYLGSESLFVKDEDSLVRSLAQWSGSDQDKGDLVKYIRVDEVTPECLAPLEGTELHSSISKALESDSLNNNVTNRRSRGINKYLLAIGFDSREIEYLDLDNLAAGWATLTEIPNMRYGSSGASLATWDNLILVTGGVGRGGILKAVKRLMVFNVSTNTWIQGPEMISARKCHASGITNGRLYVAGGTDEQQPILSAECLDLREPQSRWHWEQVQSLDMWHNGTKMLEIPENIMAVLSIYGADNDKAFDVAKNNWTGLPVQGDPRMQRDRPGIGRFGGKILVAGGSEGRTILGGCELYSCVAKTWTRLGSLNVAREGAGVAEVNGKVYAIGGRGSRGTVEVLEDEEGEWKVLEGVKMMRDNEEYMVEVLNRVV